MMMAEAAIELGHEIISLDPNPNCSITRFSKEHIYKDYNDVDALSYINSTCDVITYEFENVNLEVLNIYIDKIPQKLEALRISRDRIVEKHYARRLGITTPKYMELSSSEALFYPSIVKTTTGGYDGKGQYMIDKLEDVNQIDFNSGFTYICEELIHFDYEISVVASRDVFGNIVTLPIPVNKHVNGILHTSTITNDIPIMIQEKAINFTKRIISNLDYIGTLAVEFFVRGSDVLFNEFAPRPHNSGHYSIEGCTTSQFKNHILAITGEEVITSELVNPTVMLNVLGQNKSYYEHASIFKHCDAHDYYKDSNKHNRKIGHITCMSPNSKKLKVFIDTITKEK